MFAGGETYTLDCTRESGWKPDLDAIPDAIARKAKILWLNYPNNPTGAVADLAFFEKAVAFAKRHDIAILHDNPYCDVAYDGYKPVSIFQVPGARDVAIEFNSWSKVYNMTGWRIGMVVGNATMVDALMRVKSNVDSGIPQAIQEMAIEAVYGPQDCIDDHNAIYQKRRDRMVEGLRGIGLQVDIPRASLYVWAKLPEGTNSGEFAARLIEDTAVVVTPGRGYGKNGEGYIRLSVTTPDDRVEEGMKRIAAWKGM
jgi:LL-diaminopimelate aminotransferase